MTSTNLKNALFGLVMLAAGLFLLHTAITSPWEGPTEEDPMFLARILLVIWVLLAALIISAIFLYALYSFLLSFSYYPTAYSVKQLMSSNMRIGLASSMALNFRQAVRFAACRISVAVPIWRWSVISLMYSGMRRSRYT